MIVLRKGMKFRYPYADANPEWELVKTQNKGWLCEITHESEYVGAQRFFTYNEIRALMGDVVKQRVRKPIVKKPLTAEEEADEKLWQAIQEADRCLRNYKHETKPLTILLEAEKIIREALYGLGG